jgi:PadR family transcriptional regulator, regulatory protein PadR
MATNRVEQLVYEWDDVYKKGQSSLWVLLSLYDGKKYAAEIAEFMYDATNGTFEVKDQSLYRALRRFKGMDMVSVSEEDSPNGGPKRKFYELTPLGRAVLAQFISLHIMPLMNPRVRTIIEQAQLKGE